LKTFGIGNGKARAFGWVRWYLIVKEQGPRPTNRDTINRDATNREAID